MARNILSPFSFPLRRCNTREKFKRRFFYLYDGRTTIVSPSEKDWRIATMLTQYYHRNYRRLSSNFRRYCLTRWNSHDSSSKNHRITRRVRAHTHVYARSAFAYVECQASVRGGNAIATPAVNPRGRQMSLILVVFQWKGQFSGGRASIMENNASRPVGLAWIWLNYTDYAPDCVYHTPTRGSVSFRRLCLSNSRVRASGESSFQDRLRDV